MAFGEPVILPKWKGPGVNLVINKHIAPVTGLHVAVSKATDGLSFGKGHFGHCGPVQRHGQEMSGTCLQRREVGLKPWTWLIVDCFHHLLCSEAPVIWHKVAPFWTAHQVSADISLPLRQGGWMWQAWSLL